jgi:hypothetical protein
MVILGFAITALMVANRSYSTANGQGLEMSTAEFLIEQVRERSANMAFGGLGGLAGTYLKDSQGTALIGYPGYLQKVTVQNVSTYGPSADFCKLTVEIDLNNELVSSASWIRANY